MKMNMTTQDEREQLITRVINLARVCNSIPTTEKLTHFAENADFWIRLKDDVILLREDVKNFANKHGIDISIWRELFMVFPLWSRGMGDGGKHTIMMMNQINDQIQLMDKILVAIHLPDEAEATQRKNEKRNTDVESPQKPKQVFFESLDESMLIIGSHKIQLKNQGKEPDALRLMKTLEKDPAFEWGKSDVFDDWGMNQDDIDAAPEKKIYYAARHVCNAVAKECGIKDFLEYTLLTVQISPKYLKK